MPRVRSKAKPDPSKVYLAWQSYAIGDSVVERGSRRRGDDEMLRQAFAMWVEDGTPDAELPDVFGGPDPVEDNPEGLDVQVMADLAEYQEPHVVVLNRDIKVGVGLDRGRPARVVELRKGARFLASAELPTLKPDYFEDANGRRS